MTYLHAEGGVSIPGEPVALQPSQSPDERKRVPVLSRDHSEDALAVGRLSYQIGLAMEYLLADSHRDLRIRLQIARPLSVAIAVQVDRIALDNEPDRHFVPLA